MFPDDFSTYHAEEEVLHFESVSEAVARDEAARESAAAAAAAGGGSGVGDAGTAVSAAPLVVAVEGGR